MEEGVVSEKGSHSTTDRKGSSNKLLDSTRNHNEKGGLKLTVSADAGSPVMLVRAKSDLSVMSKEKKKTTKSLKVKKLRKDKLKMFDMQEIIKTPGSGYNRTLVVILPSGEKKTISPKVPSDTLYSLLQRFCREIGESSIEYNFGDHNGELIADLSVEVSEYKSDLLKLIPSEDSEGPPVPDYIPKAPSLVDNNSNQDNHLITIYCPNGVKKKVTVQNKENLKTILEKICRDKGLLLDSLIVEDSTGHPIPDIDIPVANIPGDFITLVDKNNIKNVRKNQSISNSLTSKSEKAKRTQSSKEKTTKDKLDMVRSLSITILEIKGIIIPNPIYAVIEIEGDLRSFVTPTVIMDKEDNFWGHVYHIANPPISSIQVKFFESRPKSTIKKAKSRPAGPEKKVKEKCLTSYTAKLSDFPTGTLVSEWYPMTGSIKDSSVRLKILLTETQVLPPEDYQNFVNVLIQPDMSLITLLETISNSSEWVDIAKRLMHVLHYGNCWQPYLEKTISEEVKSCTNEGTLFRGNCLGIAALRFYLEYLGRIYLQNALNQHIKHIITSKLPCDLKATDPKEYEINVANLLSHLTRLMESVITSSSYISAGMKYLFRFLRSKAEEKFGEHAGLTAVTGFLFLRFLVPAIRDPLAYGLWSFEIEPEEKKTLNSIAQLIQKISSLSSKFRADDVYAPFSQYIDDTSQKFLKFIDEISSLEELPKKNAGLPLNPLIAYDAACLVHIFNQHSDYYPKNPEDPTVKTIIEILEPINQKSSRSTDSKSNKKDN